MDNAIPRQPDRYTGDYYSSVYHIKPNRYTGADEYNDIAPSRYSVGAEYTDIAPNRYSGNDEYTDIVPNRYSGNVEDQSNIQSVVASTTPQSPIESATIQVDNGAAAIAGGAALVAGGIVGIAQGVSAVGEIQAGAGALEAGLANVTEGVAGVASEVTEESLVATGEGATAAETAATTAENAANAELLGAEVGAAVVTDEGVLVTQFLGTWTSAELQVLAGVTSAVKAISTIAGGVTALVEGIKQLQEHAGDIIDGAEQMINGAGDVLYGLANLLAVSFTADVEFTNTTQRQIDIDVLTNRLDNVKSEVEFAQDTVADVRAKQNISLSRAIYTSSSRFKSAYSQKVNLAMHIERGKRRKRRNNRNKRKS